VDRSDDYLDVSDQSNDVTEREDGEEDTGDA